MPTGERIAIFNGERCTIIGRGPDFIDALFPGGTGRPDRIARLLQEGERPPEGATYGYAMTVHKAQGSQFDFVAVVTARADQFVSRPSIYTAASRALKRLIIIGDETELIACAEKAPKRRRTLLSLIDGEE